MMMDAVQSTIWERQNMVGVALTRRDHGCLRPGDLWSVPAKGESNLQSFIHSVVVLASLCLRDHGVSVALEGTLGLHCSLSDQ